MDAGHRYSDAGVRKPYLKHATLACDNCRRRRCKCNGLRPCSMCRRLDVACAYTHNDRRTQRGRQNLGPDPVDRRDLPQVFSKSDPDSREDLEPGSLDIDSTEHDPESACDSFDSIPTSDPSTSQLAVLTMSISRPSVRTTKPQHRSQFKRIAAASSRAGAQADPVGIPFNSSEHGWITFKARAETLEVNDGGGGASRESLSSVYDMEKLEDSRGHLTRESQEPLPAFLRHAPSYHGIRASAYTPSTATHDATFSDLTRRELCKTYAVPGYTRVFGNLPFSSAIGSNGYPSHIQTRQALNFSAPEHLILPLVEVDDSPLARALTDFQHLGRSLITSGTPQVADQGLIDVTLFFRERLPKDPVNASNWAAEMLRSFRGTFPDPLLLACAAFVAALMRWLLVPTAQSYSDIPNIARPTHLQRLMPHPAWVDLMVFPSFRDALVGRVREWVGPCMRAGWNILWPHSLESALTRPADTERIFINPEFATFADNPNNWLMQRSILEEFEEIRGTEINIANE